MVVRRRYLCISLFIVLICSSCLPMIAPATTHGTFSVSDFGPTADRIEFDNGVSVEDAIIRRVTLDFVSPKANKTIDDLIVEPGQDVMPEVVKMVAPAITTLNAPESSRRDKLNAVNTLQRFPSTDSSLAIQKAAKTDPDVYIRERAIMALTQIADPEAVPTLVEIGLNPPNSEVRMAALC